MEILELSFKQDKPNVIIDNVKFENLNVLVGISGAGKTTIISALKTLVLAVKGANTHSIQWRLKFSDDLKRQVVWSGKVSEPLTENEDAPESGSIISETLLIDGKSIFSRSETSIVYNGVTLPKLDSLTSLIYQFRDDEGINSIYTSLSSITIVDVDSNEFSRPNAYPIVSQKLINGVEHANLKDIKQISQRYRNLQCREKIYFAFKYDQQAFDDFVFTYTSIFPQVKNIEPRLTDAITDDSKDKRQLIYIDMHMQSGEVVNQSSISSGMFKTMMILGELYFGNNETPIVIDEIENSLGVNCLPDVLSEMEEAENQIIVTSHHPQVINMIPARFWSIVARQGDKIQTQKAESIIQSSSNHDKFIQLINSKLYKGI